MKVLLAAMAAMHLAACAGLGGRQATDLNAIARDYVRLVLEMDTHEPGYVDAYYGPAEWREAAQKSARDVASLKQAADGLIRRLSEATFADAEAAGRARVLLADAQSARFRLDMIDGARASFVEEAARLFALTPALHPLSTYDKVLARIEALAPGPGPLAERVESMRARYAIPDDRLEAVMTAAIAECRRRTAEHIPLPAGESFTIELVKNVSWGAYNYYKGQNRSVIQINTDLPVSIGNALVLGCHEGYPGHHVQGIMSERAWRERGWPEYTVAPLYAPAAPLNEGGADFGVRLAFPGPERLEFEMRVLYPLAGLDPATAPALDALREATDELDGALLKIAQMHLDGEITREQAITLSETYRLAPRDVAEQSLEFEDHYRTYMINYSEGEALVRQYVDRAGDSPAARWGAYLHIISTPILPRDLLP